MTWLDMSGFWDSTLLCDGFNNCGFCGYSSGFLYEVDCTEHSYFQMLFNTLEG